MKTDPDEHKLAGTRDCPKCGQKMVKFQRAEKIHWKCFACGEALDIVDPGPETSQPLANG